MFDFSKLIGRIIEKYGTREAFADAIGMAQSALSARLNNKVPFKPVEMWLISSPDILDIHCCEIGVYFFTPKVLNLQTCTKE